MNYDLIELAKSCPDLTISVRLSNLVEANRGLIEQKKVLTDITSEVRQVKSSLETVKKEQVKHNDVLRTDVEEAKNNLLSYAKQIIAAILFLTLVILAISGLEAYIYKGL